MALYNINVDAPGGKKSLAQQSVPPSSSSTLIHLIQVVLDPDYMQETFVDGYIPCEANTSTTSVKFNADATVKANEYRGQWIQVNFPTQELRVVQSNTAAAQGAEVTVTVAQPFSQAPTEGSSCSIRFWEDWYIPYLVGSVDEFASHFLTTTTAGKPDWTNTRAAYAQLRKLFGNGARYVWVVPVEKHETPEDLVAALNPEYNTIGAGRLLSLAPAPTIIVNPKHPELTSGDGSVLSDSQAASTDSTWISYIQSRALGTNDESARELIYVADTGYVDTASAVSYVTSSVNTTEARVFWVHGQHLSNSEVAGVQMVDSPATAWAGMINRISVTAPESFGHSLYGEKWTALNQNEGGLLEVNQTPSNRTSLRNAGINHFRTVQGRGTFMEAGNFTAAKNSSSSGLDPDENCHVIVTRAKIWNDLQPILGSLVSEANTPINRAKLEGQISGYMNSLLQQGVVQDYTLVGTTTSADILAKTARFTLNFYAAGVVDFVELKLVSNFAS